MSSRAHGVICGAVLGIPSVLIEIEPKLRTIHEMLPQSTVLHPPDELSLQALLRAIDAMLECEKSVLFAEVEHNRLQAGNAVD